MTDTANAPERETMTLQQRVSPWLLACFGAEISADRLERGDRLLEEVFELLQSGGYPQDRIQSLRDYVWSREVGDPAQEVGGVMITLAAYCLAHGLDMREAGETELARIWTKVDKIRAKQAAKPTGSALPQKWDTNRKATHCDELVAAAYLDAARVPTGFLVGDPPNGIPLRNPMAHEVAEAIKARTPDNARATLTAYGERMKAEAAREAQAKIARLAEALNSISDMKPHHAGQTSNEYHMQEIARAALKESANE